MSPEPHIPPPPWCIRLLLEAGLDADNSSDLHRLAELIRMGFEALAERDRRLADAEIARRERRSRMYGVVYGLLGTVAGGLIAWLTPWLAGHI